MGLRNHVSEYDFKVLFYLHQLCFSFHDNFVSLHDIAMNQSYNFSFTLRTAYSQLSI